MLTILQTDPYDGVDAVSGAAAAGLGIGTMFISLLVYIFYGYCMYKIFQKAGREDAWAAFVPIYNIIVLLDIVKKPTWWIILFFIPFVNLFASWVVNDRLAKGFAKETPLYTLLLFFLGFIFIPVLGLGSDPYDSKRIPND
ncbi:DUF5684 domain-containing protein [Chryseobacterium sp. WG14]|uniref:DUF5684 domain-containing protein n=1 Tax=unclassified Chryseobacterium TaxID=2593645 RepID=UPI001DD05D32|nr:MULTISPECIES: DUF5684 domain-containing protein [unclassified Chryseobacterium]MCQ9636168.1 DUF5684 domain-containing protein [Chryseobacterium sp. WG23]MCQ9638457.1 DUF5684 domain-containing protein [Chryseobacterium sp. WG14]CAH0161177.1 hypothetical protein SRABI04_01015 [Chryseobacterium sp. Bi04]